MSKKSIDLFDYHDYREYLKDWFDLSRQNYGLSLRDVAEKCGLATGYLPMILAGKRNLSAKSLSKLLPLLQLNQKEVSYFNLLLDLSDSTDSDERLKVFKEIKKLRSFKEKSTKELEVHEYLSNWLNVAIREMAFRRDFENDPAWIRERLVITMPEKEIAESLQFLIEHGFLIQKKNGSLSPSKKQLDCFSGVYRLSLAEFHKQMFVMAGKSIDNTARDKRNLLGHTLLIPENKIEDLRAILDETLKKVEALSTGEGEAGPVYHVILSTFPLAEKGS